MANPIMPEPTLRESVIQPHLGAQIFRYLGFCGFASQ